MPFNCNVEILHNYITLRQSYLEWPKVQILLNHYYTRCAELETAKQLGRKLSGKEMSFQAVSKTDSVEAEVTSSGRLFQRQHPATGNARSPTVATVYVGSLAARMTTTGDGDSWKQRRSGCSQKDTVMPSHAGIGR